MKRCRRALIGAMTIALVGAVTSTTIAKCPAIFTAPCLIAGCTIDTNRPVTGAVCCKDDPIGAGCCTYNNNTGYQCVKDGVVCSCGSVIDVGGTCNQPSQPDPFTNCNVDSCSPNRGTCQ